MTDETTGAEAPSEPVFTPSLPADTGPVNARDAANLISRAREKALAAPESTTEQPRVNGRFASAAAPESTPQGEDAAAAPQPPGEEGQGTDPADEQPSIDPPRSWSAEDKEAFKLLPPERQRSIVDTERKRDADIRRTQDEVANRTKELTAKEQAAEQARQDYERKASSALQVLQAQTANEFPDIKTHDDLVKLATDDPFRAIQYQARQQQLAALHQEVQSNEAKRLQSEKQKFDDWSKEQDSKFDAQFKEFTDPEKGPKLREGLRSYLIKDVGIPETALPELWNNPLFRDSLTQRMIYDAYRWNAAKQQATKAVEAPKPPVQRPGTGSQKGSGVQEAIAAAADRLNNSKGIQAARAAADLMAARRKAARH